MYMQEHMYLHTQTHTRTHARTYTPTHSHTLHLFHGFRDDLRPLVGGREYILKFCLLMFFFQKEGGGHFVL